MTKKNILKNQPVNELLSPPTFHCSFIWSNMLYQVEYKFCIDCSKYIPKKLYKVHVRLHEKGDLERGVEEQDMIKDEVGVGIYLELWAWYDQVWGRSRAVSWSIEQNMIKDEVGVELYIKLKSRVWSRMR